MLTSPGRAEEHDIVLGGDEIQRAEVGDGVAFEAAGVVEVELLQRLSCREPGSPDTTLTAVGFSCRYFALQARRQVFLVGPVLRPGPFGQPSRGLTQRRAPSTLGSGSDLCGHVTRCGGGLGGHQAAPPSRSTPNAVS